MPCLLVALPLHYHSFIVRVDTAVKERIIQIHPLREPFVGMKVVCGPNWSFVNQDGGAGTVKKVVDTILDHTTCVKWPNVLIICICIPLP